MVPNEIVTKHERVRVRPTKGEKETYMCLYINVFVYTCVSLCARARSCVVCLSFVDAIAGLRLIISLSSCNILTPS